jgi:hypothetical protein
MTEADMKEAEQWRQLRAIGRTIIDYRPRLPHCTGDFNCPGPCGGPGCQYYLMPPPPANDQR